MSALSWGSPEFVSSKSSSKVQLVCMDLLRTHLAAEVQAQNPKTQGVSLELTVKLYAAWVVRWALLFS